MKTAARQKLYVILGAIVCAVALVIFLMSNGSTSQETGHVTEKEAATKDETGHGGESHDEGVVKKTPEELEALGAKIAIAGPGKIATQVLLQGTLEPLPDSIGHIVPRIPGVVREVLKRLGDSVRKGEILAVLESKDLADAKSLWLVAKEKLSSAESALKREEALRAKKLTSEQEYLNAKKAVTEARIEHSSSLQKLESLGLTQSQLSGVHSTGKGSLVRYELKSPLAGVVVERHLTVGETTKADEAVFVVAELSKVNAVLQVFPKDLALIQKGLKGVVSLQSGAQKATGVITFVSPILDPSSRAAKAHIEIANTGGNFRPGLSVNAELEISEAEAAVVIMKEAVQKIENKNVVFVHTSEGFVPSPIEIGRSNNSHVEIISGLDAGEKFVSAGSFLLKAEQAKSEAGHEH